MNPILPGFNPDPSIVRVDGVYYLVTSTFEYLPGLPVYRSDDLNDWKLIGHVATREEQLGIRRSPTPGGVFAPTIRHHDGRFHVIVSVMFNARGCVLFTAESPEGPWSDGVEIPAVSGIDPDLVWDDDGNAYVTFAELGHGIRQVRVDLETGEALEEPRSLWSGTGLHAPEGPHIFRRGGCWYLLLAEGGTERGHTVAIARGSLPTGPFEGFADNPILTARSTSDPVQNVGHADLVEAPDGTTALVALGVRPTGFSRSFSPLGRETFLTRVEWIDGWPQVAPITLASDAETVVEGFDASMPLGLSGWMAVRQEPDSLAEFDDNGRVVLAGRGTDLRDPLPVFIGRRQPHLSATFSARLAPSTGIGGIAGRHSEAHWFGIEARQSASGTLITGRAALAGFTHEWHEELPPGEVVLTIRSREPSGDLSELEVGGDRIELLAAPAEDPSRETVLTVLDGRYWAYETTECFTGRVLGLYAVEGSVAFSDVTYQGRA